MSIFFISDTHLNHSNILRYCNRPFTSAEEHDRTLIDNWNRIVGPHDSVYHLGDVALGSPSFCRQLVDRLNGKIFLIRGNHDKALKKEEYSSRFEWIKDYFELTVQLPEKKLIVLSHYKFQVWNKKHFGSWHLYGHSHGKLAVPMEFSLDVGVDVQSFSPVSLKNITNLMENKNSQGF